MNKRRPVLTVLLLFFLCASIWVFFSADPFPRRLSQYAILHWDGNPRLELPGLGCPLREMGSNAIPYLLDWIHYEPPAWKRMVYPAVNGSLRRLGFSKTLNYDEPIMRAQGAIYCFALLGSVADAAVPELARMMNDPKATNVARHATKALTEMRKSIPALAALLTNGSAQVRLDTLGQIQFLGTNAGPLLPAWFACLNDADEKVAGLAALLLGHSQFEPDLVLPALEKAGKDPRARVRECAEKGLDVLTNRPEGRIER